MGVALASVLVALGCCALALLLFRLRYSYKIIRTNYFLLETPWPWAQHSIFVVALLEICRHNAQDHFGLPQEAIARVSIRPGWYPNFWYQPESQCIEMRFLFGPAIDKWLFAIDFAIAHEYGHFALHLQNQVASEAWANFFCLHTLQFAAINYPWPHFWERWLIYRDILVELTMLQVWHCLPGHRHEIAAKFRELWREGRQDARSVILALHHDGQLNEEKVN